MAALHEQGKGTKDIAEALGITKASVSYHKSMLGVAKRQAEPVDWNIVADDIRSNINRNDLLKKHHIGANRFNAAIANGLIPSRECRSFDPKLHLVADSNMNRKSVKKYLLENGLLENHCVICAQGPEWNGKTLVMVLDHKNGINNDNRLENLRMLCPNCNSQTETFAGRNVSRQKTK